MKKRYPPEKLKSPIITHCKVCGEKKGKSISPTCRSCAMKEIRSRPTDFIRRENQSQAQKGVPKNHGEACSRAMIKRMEEGFRPQENFGQIGGGGYPATIRNWVKVDGAGMHPEIAEWLND